MDKNRKGGDIYSCEQERAERKARYKAQNYNQWKYKKRRGLSKSDMKQESKDHNHNAFCRTDSETGIMTHNHDTGKNND
eukprot:5632580-Heterocapsa_arctica.AAC.1